MKKLFVVLVLAIGCTSAYRASYITTGALTTAVELAREAYVQHENTCLCVTLSEHAKVQSYYLKYQMAAKVASDALAGSQGSTVPNTPVVTAAIGAAQAAAQDTVSLVESLLSSTETTVLKAKLPVEAKLK